MTVNTQDRVSCADPNAFGKAHSVPNQPLRVCGLLLRVWLDHRDPAQNFVTQSDLG